MKFDLALRGEHILRVSENRGFTIFGPKMVEVTGSRREMHSKEFNNL
jgi:hypothetical protein